MYEYDEAGRMARSVPEVEWDEEQQGWSLALAYYRATRCPCCGGDIEECGPQTAGTWATPPPRRCYRTDSLLLAQEGSKHARREALMWRTERKRG